MPCLNGWGHLEQQPRLIVARNSLRGKVTGSVLKARHLLWLIPQSWDIHPFILVRIYLTSKEKSSGKYNGLFFCTLLKTMVTTFYILFFFSNNQRETIVISLNMQSSFISIHIEGGGAWPLNLSQMMLLINSDCRISLSRKSLGFAAEHQPITNLLLLISQRFLPTSEPVFIPRHQDHTAATQHPGRVSQKHSCFCGSWASSYKIQYLSFPRNSVLSLTRKRWWFSQFTEKKLVITDLQWSYQQIVSK